VGESHISKDAADVMQEAVNLLTEYDRLLSSSGGQSGEVRIAKARVDSLQVELMKKDTELAAFKKKVLETMAAEIKTITGELGKINSSASAGDPVVQSGAKAITQSLRKLVEGLSK